MLKKSNLLVLLIVIASFCGINLQLCAQSKAILDWQPDENLQKPKLFTEFEIKEFMTAVENGKLEQVEALLKKRPDLVKLKDVENWTPLIMAARFNQAAVLLLLLKKGASIDDVDGDGYSALHHASASGKLETVKLLVENRAKINLKTRGGETPRSLAVSSGHAKVGDYLKKKKGY